MIPKNNTLYKTPNSQIQRFAPFKDNIKKELDDFKKKDRQYKDDKVLRQSFPHSGQDELHWNTVTNKMDKNLSKAQIEDRIKAIESDDEVKDTDHKYKLANDGKIIKSFEAFNEFGAEMNQPEQEVQYEPDTHTTSYMFFGNLETIHRLCSEMMEMDQSNINDLLNDGHNWAEDHISVAKENITHVFNFLSNKEVTENMDMPEMGHSENHNYMFFGNIESICRMTEKLLEFNESEVDALLSEGHDWAEDHISAAKEDVQQVHDWLENEL